jgi:hypothetical protein
MNRNLRLIALVAMSVTLLAAIARAEDPGAPEGTSTPTVQKPSVDAGGGPAASPSYRFSGTVGQPDVGDAASLSFRFQGGRWPEPNGTDTSSIFSDGFESGDTGAWSGFIGVAAAK